MDIEVTFEDDNDREDVGDPLDLFAVSGPPDAEAWAKAFVEVAKENPEIATDEGAMIAWFANAFCAAEDNKVAEFAASLPYDVAQQRRAQDFLDDLEHGLDPEEEGTNGTG